MWYLFVKKLPTGLLRQFCSSRKVEARLTRSSAGRVGEVPSLTPFGVRGRSCLLLFFPLLFVLICLATGYGLSKVVWEIRFQFTQQHIHGEVSFISNSVHTQLW
jgi:hypothetical protein